LKNSQVGGAIGWGAHDRIGRSGKFRRRKNQADLQPSKSRHIQIRRNEIKVLAA
jgi:hypothetical protein